MKFSVCNEMFQQTPFEDVCRIARDIGYTGVELAPFTFADHVGQLNAGYRSHLRRVAADYGLEIAGIHWLLVKPEGLHMTTPDDALRLKTRDYLVELVHFCADIGGKILVCGSPKQRNILDDRESTKKRAIEVFHHVALAAEEREVYLLLEPLAPTETNFVNNAAEACEIIDGVNHPNFQLILDVKAMSGGETRPIPDVIRANRARMRHFHANDPNLLGPGMGDLDQSDIGRTLREIQYQGWVSVEVFKFELGGENIARQSFDALQRWFA